MNVQSTRLPRSAWASVRLDPPYQLPETPREAPEPVEPVRKKKFDLRQLKQLQRRSNNVVFPATNTLTYRNDSIRSSSPSPTQDQFAKHSAIDENFTK
jgi:hypothetical protein